MLAELIVVLNVAERIAFIARPITRFSHLSDAAGASFMMAFFSAASANFMLSGYYNDRIIEKRELFVPSRVNSFPATTMHWRSSLPVLIPLLGFSGLVYFGLLMLVGLLKSGLVMVAGRILLENKTENTTTTPITTTRPSTNFAVDDRRAEDYSRDRPPLKNALKISTRTARPKVVKVVKMTTAMMFLVSVLIEVGAFDLLSLHLSGIRNYLPPSGRGPQHHRSPVRWVRRRLHRGRRPPGGGRAIGKGGGGHPDGRKRHHQRRQGLPVADPLSRRDIFGPRIGTELVVFSTGLRDVIMLLVVAFGVMVFW